MPVLKKNIDDSVQKLISRQNYLVTQANDLARSFGNLSAFEHKILDFCFSYVQKDDPVDKVYSVQTKDIIKHFGLNQSGRSYERIVKAFNALKQKTAIYMVGKLSDGRTRAILSTSLFDYVAFGENGVNEFHFSSQVAPYVFQLKKHYYSFKLSELGKVRSKYSLALLKLWNAHSSGKLNGATIEGNVEEWEGWLLGSDKDGKIKKVPAGVFKRDMLNHALKELEKLYPKVLFSLETHKDGTKVTGYALTICPIKTNVQI